ncbi:MAG: hypothetical protein IPM60_16510 [Rhodospirillales bacterium]|nr:hypothetical protein [Rhodospirillales bacterium]
MKSGAKAAGVSRRAFIGAAGLAAGAAGIAAAGVAASAAPTAAKSETGRRPAVGYRETQHVRRAYALARF